MLPSPANPAPAGASLPWPVRARRVVVLEEEPASLVLAEFLAGEGATVVHAQPGAEGFERVKAFAPDLVVSYRESAGHDVFAWMSADSATRAIPVLFLAAPEAGREPAPFAAAAASVPPPGLDVAAITEELLTLVAEPDTGLALALDRICERVQAELAPCLASASLITGAGWELACARGVPRHEWRGLDRAVHALGACQPGVTTFAAAERQRWRSVASVSRFGRCCRLPFADRAGRLVGAFHFFLSEAALLPGADQHEGALASLARLATVVFEHNQLAERVSQARYFDPVTALLNRGEFDRQLERAIGEARASGRSFWTIALDFPRFVRVLELTGRREGDSLLAAVGERLRGLFRGHPVLARLEGAVFAAMLPAAAGPPDAAAVEILRRLSEPYRIGGSTHFLQAAAGLARFPDHGGTADGLLACAEVALHAAARCGTCGFRVYAPGMKQMLGGVDMETVLRSALEEQRFALHYQPLFENPGGRLAGFEALLRLQHTDQSVLSPALFLPAAEESGLIVPIGLWAIREACRSIRNWRRELGASPRVAVNVSAGQLAAPGFADEVGREIERWELPPGALEIELTESLLMTDLDHSRRILEQLKSLGLSLAIDDFGTGYSSLAYLHCLPVDKLKIDQSFVRSIGKQNSTLPVIRAIIAMAEQLGLRVVAEGVETEEQRQALHEARCHELQGYLFGRPMPHAQAGALARSAALSTPSKAEL